MTTPDLKKLAEDLQTDLNDARNGWEAAVEEVRNQDGIIRDLQQQITMDREFLISCPWCGKEFQGEPVLFQLRHLVECGNNHVVATGYSKAATICENRAKSLQESGRFDLANEALKCGAAIRHHFDRALQQHTGEVPGYVRVPREPTQKMLDRGTQCIPPKMGCRGAKSLWYEMVDAALEDGETKP